MCLEKCYHTFGNFDFIESSNNGQRTRKLWHSNFQYSEIISDNLGLTKIEWDLAQKKVERDLINWISNYKHNSNKVVKKTKINNV